MYKKITLIALHVSDDIFIAGIVGRLGQTPTLNPRFLPIRSHRIKLSQ